MRVLITYDKFKDSMTAEEACGLTARSIQELHPDWSIDTAPLTDGGDGFGRILTESAKGRTVTTPARGPFLEPRTGEFGEIEIGNLPLEARDLLSGLPSSGLLAVIEMASINGLALLPQDRRTPWKTSTFGTGQLIRAAAEAGVAGILLGVGGSATNDLGLGALAALGMRFLQSDGTPVDSPVPERWEGIHRIEGRISPPLPPIWIACDVDNPLLGERGASAVFGPQKGLKAKDLPVLEAVMKRMADLLCDFLGHPVELQSKPGTGAAGGISFGLMAATGAVLVSGSDLMTAWLRLKRRIAEADMVITGEGGFDGSSLEGKGPGAVVTQALLQGKRTLVFAGRVEEGLKTEAELYGISPPGLPLEEALARGRENLRRTVAEVIGK